MHNHTSTTESQHKAHSSDRCVQLIRRLRALSFIVAAQEFSEWAADIQTGVLEQLNALAVEIWELVTTLLVPPIPSEPFPNINAI